MVLVVVDVGLTVGDCVVVVVVVDVGLTVGDCVVVVVVWDEVVVVVVSDGGGVVVITVSQLPIVTMMPPEKIPSGPSESETVTSDPSVRSPEAVVRAPASRSTSNRVSESEPEATIRSLPG